MPERSPVQQLHRWLRKAKPGDRHIYHTGFLMRDRWIDKVMDGGFIFRLRRGPVNEVAIAALALSDAHLVFLTQGKVADGNYIYYAQRSSLKLQ